LNRPSQHRDGSVGVRLAASPIFVGLRGRVRAVEVRAEGVRTGELVKQVEPVGGRIQLCGLDPLLRDMVRITHLDGVFDVCCDETEALGLIVP
jgi:hypothetical protein